MGEFWSISAFPTGEFSVKMVLGIDFLSPLLDTTLDLDNITKWAVMPPIYMQRA